MTFTMLQKYHPVVLLNKYNSVIREEEKKQTAECYFFNYKITFSRVKACGELSRDCADAYFCYGCALLDLGRMETNVLGVALEGGKNCTQSHVIPLQPYFSEDLSHSLSLSNFLSNSHVKTAGLGDLSVSGVVMH